MMRVKPGLVGRVAAHAIGLWLMASGGLRGETLGAVLAANGMDPRLVSEANASTEITSYGAFKSQDLFVIAYYRDTGNAQLSDRLEVLSFETAEQNWQHKELGLAHFREETQLPRPGAITEIRASEEFLFVRGHKNPSAAVTLVLNRSDLEFSDALYGWVVGNFADGLVVYEHSQVHFAPTHYTELSLYDPIRKEHRNPSVPAAAEGAIVGVLVDTSGTVRGRADEVFAAVRQLLEASSPPRNAEWFLVSFDTEVRLEEDFTSDVGTLRRTLQNLMFQGEGTSLYDAVYLGVDKARSRPRTPKVLIVFTDGRDKGSHTSHRELLRKLKPAGVKVHFVLFPSDDMMLPHLKPGPGEIRKRIGTIAAATGGKTFIARSKDPLTLLIERLVDELCR